MYVKTKYVQYMYPVDVASFSNINTNKRIEEVGLNHTVFSGNFTFTTNTPDTSTGVVVTTRVNENPANVKQLNSDVWNITTENFTYSLHIRKNHQHHAKQQHLQQRHSCIDVLTSFIRLSSSSHAGYGAHAVLKVRATFVMVYFSACNQISGLPISIWIASGNFNIMEPNDVVVADVDDDAHDDDNNDENEMMMTMMLKLELGDGGNGSGSGADDDSSSDVQVVTAGW
ncbi:hypothetical protein FF38_13527 [Lucilia cuprina]|uniref:Uncharacterized protein n=1 Tax=Lucilia cuprina TaxID=7375 RepID=A0A0L0CCG1_LUCCU|nr:hypothetical protein FF38_13527 [Lucilia cuprina]